VPSVTGHIVAPVRHQDLLHTVIVADGPSTVAHRPLPYGAALPDAADWVLRDLGYRRRDAWAPSDYGWRCAVEPLT
jgi:hypothetical protein